MPAPAGRMPAPSGPSKPAAPSGYQAVGTGRGNWVFQRSQGGGQRGAGQRGSSPLLNPGQSLSGQSLLNAAQQLANVQINPAISDLQKQIAANNAQNQGTINQAGGFYNQLEPFVQKGVDQSGQIAQGLNTTLQGIGAQTQSQLQGIGQGAQAALSKYTPQGDGGIANSATADLAAQIAKQQGLAAQQSQTARNFGATQGANSQQLANSQLGTFGLQGQEALRNIAQSGTVRNEPLMAKIAGLQQQRGALAAADLGKLRQQQFGNQVAQAGLGLKSASLQNTAAFDRAKINTTLRGQNITAQNDAANQALKGRALSVTQQNDLASQGLRAAALNERINNDAANQALKQAALNLKAASTGRGAKPLTTSQNDQMYRLLGQAQQLVTAGQHHGLSEGQIRANLQDGANPSKKAFDPVLIQAAYEILGWGHITPATATAMHGMGMRSAGRQIRVAPGPTKSHDIGRVVSKTAGF